MRNTGTGSSRSHWNELNLHPVTPGLRGLSDEQLKTYFLERGQKKTEEEKNSVLSKARDVSVCASQGNVANDIYNRVLETDAQDLAAGLFASQIPCGCVCKPDPACAITCLKHK